MRDNLIGTKIDDFQIEERLGQGAMAVVYKAYQPSINRYVALKVIRLDEGQGLQEDFRRRFAREAELIARLEHIHILPIYAYGINAEMAYLAMRWLRGGSLSEMLRRGSVTLDRGVDIFVQVSAGLAYAHNQGIIHRDLKPSNIMLDDEGNAYLTDFGLAKLAESSGEITRSGTIVGTPAYMSPEQLRGEPLDHRSDLYSLGVILYNVAAGRLPFDTTSSDLVSVIYQHLEKPPPPPTSFNPNIPPDVEQVILRALSKDREQRYSTASDMARALNVAMGRPAGSSDSMAAMPVPRFGSQTQPTVTPPSSQAVGVRSYLPLIVTVIVGLLIVALLVIQNANTNAALTGTQTAAAATAVAAAWTPTPLPKATVLAGESGPSTDLKPSEQDLAIARQRLGENGFIAYIACTLDTEYHAGLARQLRDLASEYGVAYQVYDSETDPYREVTLVERARTDGAVALIICPLDASLLESTLTSAERSGVPLVFFADQMPSYGGVLVGGDNYLLGLEPGRLAGQIIRDEMDGEANVVILDFPDRPDIVQRADGLEDGILEFAPDANIVGRYLGGTPDFGKESVSRLIADGVEFNVIVSINDAGAFGAIQAMEEAGIDPSSVAVIGIDAEPLAQEYIRNGYYMRGSVQGTREETAYALMDSTIKLLAGATVPEFALVPPGPVVTKDTLEAEDRQ